MPEYSVTTEALYQGNHIRGMEMHPETIPCFLTTAFTMKGFKEVQETYDTKGYTYIRTRNPNRTALGEVISCLEGGEESLIFSSGMGAITTTLMAVLEPGDHVICNANIYGETFCVMTQILKKCNVDVTFVDYQNTEDIAKAVQPNTKLIYSEVFSNPTLTLVDLRAVSELAHKNGALLMASFSLAIVVVFGPMQMVSGTVKMLTFLVSMVITLGQLLLIKKFRLNWLKNFTLANALLLGMVCSVLLEKLFG